MTAGTAARSVLAMLRHYAGAAWNRYRKLHIAGKLFIWFLFMFYVSFGIFVFVVTPARIAQFLYDKAKLLAATRLGWLGLIATMVCVSFPPLIGHTTLVTLCGFAYGMEGFYIALAGSIIGSGLVFSMLRLLFSKRIRAWSAQNEKWQALESVVESWICFVSQLSPTLGVPSSSSARHSRVVTISHTQRAKGLPLIILIRVSPFPPWVYANSLFASIEPVRFWQFIVATLFISPKLLLHVFIGSKMAALSDGDQRGRMDTRDKVINGLLVGGGIVVAVFTSWWVYTLVQSHIRHLHGLPVETDELAAEAIEEFDEDAPLLSPVLGARSTESLV